MQKTAETDAFWREFTEHSEVETDYVLVSFGDTPEMADELLALVLAGTKRATASLARDYGDDREPLPKVGDYVVVVDGAGTPRCIWRSTDIEIKPLISVDDQFAWDEGEGDRSRDWWLDAHRWFFQRQAEREGFSMHDDIETVFERFEIVWPLSVADRKDR